MIYYVKGCLSGNEMCLTSTYVRVSILGSHSVCIQPLDAKLVLRNQDYESVCVYKGDVVKLTSDETQVFEMSGNTRITYSQC